MSAIQSPSCGRRYGIARVCRMWRMSRSTVYSRRAASDDVEPRRRGPKPLVSDEELVERIRAILDDVESKLGFRGEGYRKVHARLRIAGVPVGRRRVLRLMRANNLLAPTRAGRARGPRVHDGTITAELPDQMWGTDATSTWTIDDGQVTVFVAVDHCTSECVGIHAAKRGTRHEALEPIVSAVSERFGAIDRDVAVGLTMRHDHGSQYMSHAFQGQIAFLGIESSPSFVRQPEGNGISERFIRTLKEQLLWVETFRNKGHGRVESRRPPRQTPAPQPPLILPTDFLHPFLTFLLCRGARSPPRQSDAGSKRSKSKS